MSLDSPVAILYDANGVALAVQDGVVIPASTPGIIVLGSDGTDTRYMKVDSSGRPVVVGAGTAGTPTGGVLTVQGVGGGTPIPVSGTVTETNASIGVNGAAAPASSTQAGGTDGTNLQPLKMFDLDTGAGTDYNEGVSIRLPASGGSVAGGTASNPIRTDPTGTTTQPISAASLPLPTGAATEATLAGVLTTVAFQARINTLGQKTMANSTPVVIASDQSAISVTSTSSATATRTDVSASASNVTILASNASRRRGIIYNDSTSILLLLFGAGTASATNFSKKLFPGDAEDFGGPGVYTGQIDGIWVAATGSARITEFT